MSHVLRGLGRRKCYSDLPCRPFHATLLPSLDLDIISMYETAWKQQPSNEELGVNVFNVNVRVANWKAAQQVRTTRDISRSYYFIHATNGHLLGCHEASQAIQRRTLPLLVHLLCSPSGESLSQIRFTQSDLTTSHLPTVGQRPSHARSIAPCPLQTRSQTDHFSSHTVLLQCRPVLHPSCRPQGIATLGRGYDIIVKRDRPGYREHELERG